ncbi:unnamed protein product [Meloidogyne enterolobii]|uniref:Uncharacterized protein n=1 Tax=Meloidogyne enterolobii TaxID=390850 RepID=A0ACB1AES4_MELEN
MAKVQAIHSAAVAKFAEERGRNSLEFNERNNEKWKSVPELAETNDLCHQNEISQGSLRIKKRREAIDERERSIVSEALRRQFTTLKEDRDKKVGEQQKVVEELKNERKKVSELSEQLNQVTAECGLLRRENGMYEQKCVEMDRDRQKMYLVMFRKGQQAASKNIQKLEEEEEEMDEKTELQVVTRFLHDAFFYYLLSKGCAREHLQAIMTMLNFTPEQKDRIYNQRGKSLQP